jgi:hypothetical protein
MKVSALKATLGEFEILLSAEMCPKIQDFQKLNAIFLGHENKTVGKFVEFLIKNGELSRQPEPSPVVAGLMELLSGIGRILGAVKAREGANDVGQIVDFLAHCPHETVEDIVASVKDWGLPRRKAAAEKPGKGGGTPAAGLIREDVVRSYADELCEAREDNGEFDAVVGRLRSDRQVRKEEMHLIATRFLGYQPTKQTREKMLLKIVDRQALEARQVARGNAIEHAG